MALLIFQSFHMQFLQPIERFRQGDVLTEGRQVRCQLGVRIIQFFVVLIPASKSAKGSVRCTEPSSCLPPNVSPRVEFWPGSTNDNRRSVLPFGTLKTDRGCNIKIFRWLSAARDFVDRSIVVDTQSNTPFLFFFAKPIGPVLAKSCRFARAGKGKSNRTNEGGFSRSVIPEDHMPSGELVRAQLQLEVLDRADVADDGLTKIHDSSPHRSHGI